jgi:replication factor A3
MSESTPRITASYLDNFQGQAVRLVGRVTQLRGDHAVIDAGGQVTVHLTRVSFLFLILFDNSCLTGLFLWCL